LDRHYRYAWRPRRDTLDQLCNEKSAWRRMSMWWALDDCLRKFLLSLRLSLTFQHPSLSS
jgi:hypothetical protein